VTKVPTKEQVSAGGVVFKRDGAVQVALISVGEKERWQLPKGLVNRGEAPEESAQREVREETGLEANLVDFIDKIEYWYYGARGGGRVRFHKTVHFYLFRYLAGDVRDHDGEVNEARWVAIDEAHTLLAFKSEKGILHRAKEMIEALPAPG
jgi:8-oxo-dGTP pyrophosphatase MutT (NUDIX family)